MKDFLKWVFTPKTYAQERINQALARETLAVDSYPEDPEVTAILANLQSEIKALREFSTRPLKIVMSRDTEVRIVSLENARAFHRGEYVHWIHNLEGHSLYGLPVEVEMDRIMEGRKAFAAFLKEDANQ